jgi:signal transduction histidine kinase
MSPRPWRDLWRHTTPLAIATALILLTAGLVGAFASAQDFQSQKIEQASAHARVLAASVSAALAFEDLAEAEQAVAALRASPEIDAVGVYRADGSSFIRWASGPAEPPAALAAASAPEFEQDHASATAPVTQAGEALGYVFVQLSAGSGASQWMRNAGPALLTAMAVLLVGAIAIGQRSLTAANRELAERAEELARANLQLSEESAERRKAQNALAQAQKMEAIGQLTGGLAHDFNNLLAAISGGLQLLEKHNNPERRAQVRTALDDAVQRGARLTRQLLSFAGRQSLQVSVVDPGARVDGMMELLQRSIGEDIVVEANFPTQPWHVAVDPDQLELVILNLAVNARDAMPGGGRIRIGAEHVARTEAPRGEFVRLSVSDNGDGMSPETLERAFEPFFTTKDVGKGTGLGLAQVYAFAKQSGGIAWIESQPGLGTTVILDLPRASPDQHGADAMAEADTRAGGEPKLPPPEGRGRRVLIVEDDEPVANMVGEILKSHGYDWVRAATAREALGALTDETFDLVFSDIVMPGGMSGVDLARELRQRQPELPVLLTTGFSGKARFEPGEFEILYKPWRPDELLHAIDAAAQAREGARQGV